jgi:DhnA family fructose-bisphosphate aldolase class Ia
MTPRHRRLSRLFAADGRCLVVALDHAGFMDKPLAGLEAPGPLVSAAVAAGADAFLLTLGSAERNSAEIGRAGLWLSVEADPRLAEPMVAEALRLGADGVKCLVYPGWEARPNSLADFSALALACRAWNLPVMAEVIPGGFMAGPEQRTAAAIAAGARVAFEAGADVIKTVYTGTPETFATVLGYCPAPVIVLGGDRANDARAVLLSVRDALDAGAAGVAIGRNIWQHPQPGRMTAALAALIHEGASVDDALAVLGHR